MKVLFLGNSHTFFNDMPQIFKNICAEKGKDVEVGMLAHPGVTYGWHYNQFTDLRFALLWGGYDYIVMQQAAHSPCPEKEETLTDAAEAVAESELDDSVTEDVEKGAVSSNRPNKTRSFMLGLVEKMKVLMEEEC